MRPARPLLRLPAFMSDRRSLPREHHEAELLCGVGHETFHAQLKNVSRSGAYFETPFLFDPAQDVRIAIDLPGHGTVAAIARPTRFVAGAEFRVGVAVRFLETQAG